MTDIAPELIEKLKKEFSAAYAENATIKASAEKLKERTATYKDAYEYAETVGELRAKTFSGIRESDLPDGRMYFNIGNRLMHETLSEDHELIAEYSAEVQTIENRKAGTGFKGMKADPDEDRIMGFVNRLDSEEHFDNVKWILNEPVKTHARSVVDDTLRKNAEFQSRAGMKVQVVRSAASDGCQWCLDLAGTYTYPGVPRDVFARHDNCRCSLDYNGRKLTPYESKNGAHSFRDQGESDEIHEPNERAQNALLRARENDAKLLLREIEKYLDKPIIDRDNLGVRKWYVANVSGIPDKIDTSKPIEDMAKQAFEMRNRIKSDARAAMEDIKTRDELNRTRPAPDWEGLIQRKMRIKNISREEAVQDIFYTSTKTNKEVNRGLGL